jgi:hypothetical protein
MAISVLAAVVLSSCVGVDATATLAKDGSGRLTLHYAVSKMVLSLGALDANERLIPFPVSREDIDRTVRGIDGLSLVSYSQKETADDLLIDAELAFTRPAALTAFLDPKGERASYTEADGKHSLRLVLAGGIAAIDPDLSKLMDAAFQPYRVAITLKLPSPVSSPGIGKSSSGGLQVDYSSPVAALAKSREPVIWEVVW